MGLTETWVENRAWEKTKYGLSKAFKWERIDASRENKKGRAMGGILTGIKKKWEEKKEKLYGVREDFLERRIVVGDNIWNFMTVYNKGGGNEIFKFLEENIPDVTQELILIGGDFNVRTAEEGSREEEGEKGQRKSKDKVINAGGRSLLSLTERKGWIILNGACEGDLEGEWTYLGPRGESVIDYCMVNIAGREFTKSMKVGKRIESDHQPLIMQLNSIQDKKEVNLIMKRDLEVDDWTEEGIRKYKENLNNVKWQNSEETIDEKILVGIIKEAVGKRKWKEKKKNMNKWWDLECWEKKRNVRKMLKKFKSGKLTKEVYFKERKSYKELCNRKKQEQDLKYEEEIKNIRNENEAWKFINRERKRKTSICEEIKMEEWKSYFCEILNGTVEKVAEITESDNVGINSAAEFTEEEILDCFKQLKKNKAAGQDGIKNEAWIYGGRLLREKVRLVLNKVWKGQEFPEEWKTGIIVPILKKGGKDQVGNYRGVTLLNTLYKIYATIINNRLKKEIEEKKMLPDTQSGFRKERGTIDNIYILKHAIDKEISQQGGKVYALFIDLKAAFDSLDRKNLWKYMEERGVDCILIQKIREIFQETKCQVKVAERYSEVFWTNAGVRQGDPLSPSLFTLYLADIEETMAKAQDGGLIIGGKKFWTLAYADDVVILAKDKRDLENMIKTLFNYLKRKKLTLNVQKSKVMVFKKGGRRAIYNKWMWGEEKIEEVKEYNYLGYLLQNTNSDEKHVQKVCAKATRAMAQVWSIGERRFRDNFKIKMAMFDSIVKGILMYGTEIWGWKERKVIENIQMKYLKWVLGVNKRTPNYMVLEESKREKMRIETGYRAFHFEEKIAKYTEKELLCACWREMISRQDRKKETKRDKERRDYLERNGYGVLKINESRNENVCLEKELRERDLDNQRQEQIGRVESSTFHEAYKFIRTEEVPEYLGRNWDSKAHQKTIARFRCGSICLGSRVWEEEDKKLCRLCDTERETIMHWIMNCREVETEEWERGMVLQGDGRGIKWMQRILEKLKKKSESNTRI